MGTIIGYLYFTSVPYYGSPSVLILSFTGIAFGLGLSMLIVSLLLYFRPDLHVAWGVIILVFAVGSFTSAFAGFAGFGLGIIGIVLGIIGGSLAIAWRPGMPGFGYPTVPQRVCLNCGRMTPYGFSFCPSCGAPMPALNPPGSGAPPPAPPR